MFKVGDKVLVYHHRGDTAPRSDVVKSATSRYVVLSDNSLFAHGGREWGTTRDRAGRYIELAAESERTQRLNRMQSAIIDYVYGLEDGELEELYQRLFG